MVYIILWEKQNREATLISHILKYYMTKTSCLHDICMYVWEILRLGCLPLRLRREKAPLAVSISARTASLLLVYLSLRSKHCPEGMAVTYLQHNISLTAISVMRYQSEATNGLGVHEAQLR